MNPSGPPGAGGPPTSFKTNVNRAKTKRWVEAKSYSYDGDDWGEVDDYDEYGGYEPGPTKPTGLRQQGQSASPMAGALQSQPQILESPLEAHEQQYIAPGGQPSKLQQEFGGQSAISTQQYQMPFQARTSSFGQGEERRTFSAGAPQHGSLSGGTKGQTPFQQDQSHSQANMQTRLPPQGPQFYQQPNQNRSRPSMDGQSRPIGQGPPPSSYRGVSYSDRPRQPGDSSRTHSMTSSTSSQEFHNRRDFSPSAMPQPLHSQNREPPFRGNSLGQEDTPRAETGSFSPSGNMQALSYGNPNVPAASASADLKDVSESSAKPLPFVRPADIYKRMVEEREKERQSQESLRPSMEAINGSRPPLPRNVSPNNSGSHPHVDVAAGVPRGQRSFDFGDDREGSYRTNATLDPVAERRSEYGIEGLKISQGTPGGNSSIPTTITTNQSPALMSSDRSLPGSPKLPDVPRMSGFGESFMGSLHDGYGDLSDFDREKNQTTDLPRPSAHLSPQEASHPSLQHQPSLGYRSVVSKAFEDQQTPSTPTSTSDSAVARSNSESTNAISPIMSRAPSAVTPESRLREVGGRDTHVPIIAEESGIGTPRPNSEEAVLASAPLARKSSPSQGPQTEVPSSQAFSTGQGHQHEISSSSASRARTPAVEVIGQLQQPQHAELAVTSPTSMTHSGSSASDALPRTTNGIIESSVDEPRSATSVESVSPINGLVGGRADSPSKGRVRNLADRFESRDVSRQGSNSSMRGSTSPKKAGGIDENMPMRPQADRLESFRPHLPGGWDSYVSNAPSHPSFPSAAGIRGQPPNLKDNEEANNLSMNPRVPRQSPQAMYDDKIPDPRTTDETPNESMDITPTTEKRTLAKVPEDPSTNDPFSAVAAAGAALAGAFTAAVGLDQHQSNQDTPDAKPSDFTSSRGRSASLKGLDVHPEAPKSCTFQDDDPASSVAPTPLSNLPEQRDDPSNPSYFPPVPPLKQRPHPIDVATVTTPSRPQILPTMSTETSPNDYESDRLRKQLVRELSPATERFPIDHLTRTDTSQVEDSGLEVTPSVRRQDHDSMFLPREYDSYWNGSSSGGNVSHRTSRQEVVSPEDSSEKQIEEKPPFATAPLTATEDSHGSLELGSGSLQTDAGKTLEARPDHLTHRFSWEPVPEEINAPFQVGNTSNTFAATPLEADDHGNLPNAFTQKRDPAQSILESTPEDDRQFLGRHNNSEKGLPPIIDREVQHGADYSTPAQVSRIISEEDMPLPSIPNESEIPPFRKILGLKDATERIHAYKTTREQFAHMRTGLDQWIVATINDVPEHSDLLNNGGMFGTDSSHRPSPSRGKFPGLRVASGQAGQQQYLGASSQANSTSPNSAILANSSGYSPGATSGRSPSHQMQVKGKDLLHSAGVFGGRASNATKGLFSKGRSKFRGSGGADKATPRDSRTTNPSQELQTSYQAHSNAQGQVPQNRLPHSSGRSRPLSSAFTHNDDFLETGGGRVSPLPASYAKGQERTLKGQLRRLSSRSDTQARTSRPASSVPDQDLLQSEEIVMNPTPVDPTTRDAFGYHTKLLPIATQGTLRDDVQSPKSASSSNRTPTQADFTNGILGQDPILPSIPLSASRGAIASSIPGTSEPSSSSRRASTEPPMPISAGGNEVHEPPSNITYVSRAQSEAPSMLQDGLKTSAVISECGLERHLFQDQPGSVTPLRTSEDSEGTFHTADSGEEFQARPGYARPADAPKVLRQHNASPLGNTTTAQGNSFNPAMQTSSGSFPIPSEPRTSTPSRPFSFISFGQLPVEDLALRGPSLDNERANAYKNLPKTPFSPLPPVPNNQSHTGPVHHGTDYDFTSETNHSVGQSRPRSFSRPFQDPNLGQHPAFRQDTAGLDSDDLPGEYYPLQVRRDEAIIPQTTEYQLDGVGPPLPEPNGKPRSRRGSLSSAIFKRLSIPPKEEVPPIPHTNERQSPESPFASPMKTEKRRKRASLFRSLIGRTGSDSNPRRENPVVPPAKSRTDKPQHVSSTPSGREEHRSFTGPPTSSSPSTYREKPQRPSMSSVPEQEKGKKRRFSALGSFFGRGSPKQQMVAIPAVLNPASRTPSQQQVPLNQQPADSHYQRPEQPRQGSAYHTNHQDYSQSAPPVGYDPPPMDVDRPPLEGYYSPDRRSGSLPLEQIGHERSPSIIRQITPQFGGLPVQNQSSYVQSHDQPQSAWVQNLMSHSPAPEMRPYPDQNSNREPIISSSGYPSQSHTQYQSTQLPSQTRRSHNPSDRSPIFGANASRVNAVMNGPQGCHEAPLERYESPPPPPPPPKDDYLVQASRSDHARSSSRYSPSQSVQRGDQTRQSLPPLKTNVDQIRASPNITPMTPEDIRRARQQQIERSGRSPQHYVVSSSQPERGETEEKVVMSSSSYPGQEWQPSVGHWDGD